MSQTLLDLRPSAGSQETIDANPPKEYLTREYMKAYAARSPFQVHLYGSRLRSPANHWHDSHVKGACRLSGCRVHTREREVLAGVTIERSDAYAGFRRHEVILPDQGYPGHRGLYTRLRIREWDAPPADSAFFRFEVRDGRDMRPGKSGRGTWATLLEAKCALVHYAVEAGMAPVAALDELPLPLEQLRAGMGLPVPAPRPLEGRAMTDTTTTKTAPITLPDAPNRQMHYHGEWNGKTGWGDEQFIFAVASLANLSHTAATKAFTEAEGDTNLAKAANAIGKATKSAFTVDVALRDAESGRPFTFKRLVMDGAVALDETVIWAQEKGMADDEPKRIWVQVGEWVWYPGTDAPFHVSEFPFNFKAADRAVLTKGTLPTVTGFGKNRPSKAALEAAAEAAAVAAAEALAAAPEADAAADAATDASD